MSRKTKPKQPLRPKSSGAARWRRRKEARPAEILEAALAVFAERGFAAARMTEIAERARVSKGTIYLYFESKEAVFRALVREMLVPRLNEAAEIVRGHDGPAAPLLAQILRVLGHFISTSDRVVLPKIVIAEAGNFPLFGSIVARGIARGEFRDIPVEHALRLCIAPLLLAAIWRTTFAPLDAEPYDYPGLIEAHIATLLRGLKKEAAA